MKGKKEGKSLNKVFQWDGGIGGRENKKKVLFFFFFGGAAHKIAVRKKERKKNMGKRGREEKNQFFVRLLPS